MLHLSVMYGTDVTSTCSDSCGLWPFQGAAAHDRHGFKMNDKSAGSYWSSTAYCTVAHEAEYAAVIVIKGCRMQLSPFIALFSFLIFAKCLLHDQYHCCRCNNSDNRVVDL